MLRVCGNNKSVTEQAKCNQLGLLKFDLAEYVRKIERGDLTIADVPFTAAQANAFLQGLSNPTVGNLIQPSGSPSSTSNAGTDISGSPQLQNLFADIENVKWTMQLSNDPTFNQQSDLLDRLEKLEARIMSYMTTDTTLPPEVKTLFEKELQLISNILTQYTGQEGYQQPGGARCPPTQSSRTSTAGSGTTGSNTATSSTGRYHSVGSSTGDYSDSDGRTNNHNQQRWNRCFFDGVPKTNPDVYIRPGYEANDNHIKSRASRAAFDESLVGGLDYKERSLALCRQIKNTDLGDPASFGCITNPAEVSATYSWKGNFKMVCSRLGNTWGGFYPEMMGCLPSDPQDKFSGAGL
jgi:hypothetical protein